MASYRHTHTRTKCHLLSSSSSSSNNTLALWLMLPKRFYNVVHVVHPSTRDKTSREPFMDDMRTRIVRFDRALCTNSYMYTCRRRIVVARPSKNKATRWTSSNAQTLYDYVQNCGCCCCYCCLWREIPFIHFFSSSTTPITAPHTIENKKIKCPKLIKRL